MTIIGKDPSEKEIQKYCLEILSLHKIFAFRNNTGMIFSEYRGKTRMIKMGYLGSPDIIGIQPITGKFFGIEVKREGKKQSENQKNFEEKCKKENALYFLVDSFEGIKNVINQLKKETVNN